MLVSHIIVHFLLIVCKILPISVIKKSLSTIFSMSNYVLAKVRISTVSTLNFLVAVKAGFYLEIRKN